MPVGADMYYTPDTGIEIMIEEDVFVHTLNLSKPPRQFNATLNGHCISLAYEWANAVLTIQSNQTLNGVTIYIN